MNSIPPRQMTALLEAERLEVQRGLEELACGGGWGDVEAFAHEAHRLESLCLRHGQEDAFEAALGDFLKGLQQRGEIPPQVALEDLTLQGLQTVKPHVFSFLLRNTIRPIWAQKRNQCHDILAQLKERHEGGTNPLAPVLAGRVYSLMSTVCLLGNEAEKGEEAARLSMESLVKSPHKLLAADAAVSWNNAIAFGRPPHSQETRWLEALDRGRTLCQEAGFVASHNAAYLETHWAFHLLQKGHAWQAFRTATDAMRLVSPLKGGRVQTAVFGQYGTLLHKVERHGDAGKYLTLSVIGFAERIRPQKLNRPHLILALQSLMKVGQYEQAWLLLKKIFAMKIHWALQELDSYREIYKECARLSEFFHCEAPVDLFLEALQRHMPNEVGLLNELRAQMGALRPSPIRDLTYEGGLKLLVWSHRHRVLSLWGIDGESDVALKWMRVFREGSSAELLLNHLFAAPQRGNEPVAIRAIERELRLEQTKARKNLLNAIEDVGESGGVVTVGDQKVWGVTFAQGVLKATDLPKGNVERLPAGQNSDWHSVCMET